MKSDSLTYFTISHDDSKKIEKNSIIGVGGGRSILVKDKIKIGDRCNIGYLLIK